MPQLLKGAVLLTHLRPSFLEPPGKIPAFLDCSELSWRGLLSHASVSSELSENHTPVKPKNSKFIFTCRFANRNDGNLQSSDLNKCPHLLALRPKDENSLKGSFFSRLIAIGLVWGWFLPGTNGKCRNQPEASSKHYPAGPISYTSQGIKQVSASVFYSSSFRPE